MRDRIRDLQGRSRGSAASTASGPGTVAARGEIGAAVVGVVEVAAGVAAIPTVAAVAAIPTVAAVAAVAAVATVVPFPLPLPVAVPVPVAVVVHDVHGHRAGRIHRASRDIVPYVVGKLVRPVRHILVCSYPEVLPIHPVVRIEPPANRRDPTDDGLPAFGVRTVTLAVVRAVDGQREPPLFHRHGIPVFIQRVFGCLAQSHAIRDALALFKSQDAPGIGNSIPIDIHLHPPVRPGMDGLGVNDGRHGDGQKRRHHDGRDEETFAAEMDARMSFAGESRHLAPSAERVHQEVLQRAGCAGSVVFLWAPAVRGETIAHPGRRCDAPGRIRFKPIGLPDYAESSAWTRGFPGSQASWERGLPARGHTHGEVMLWSNSPPWRRSRRHEPLAGWKPALAGSRALENP